MNLVSSVFSATCSGAAADPVLLSRALATRTSALSLAHMITQALRPSLVGIICSGCKKSNVLIPVGGK